MPLVPRAQRYSPTELAQALGVNVATVWRWILRGVRGKKLRSVLIGGRRYILRGEDLDEFLSQDCSPAHVDDGYAHRAENAGRVLDGIGVKASTRISGSVGSSRSLPSKGHATRKADGGAL